MAWWRHREKHGLPFNLFSKKLIFDPLESSYPMVDKRGYGSPSCNSLYKCLSETLIWGVVGMQCTDYERQ